MSIVDLIDALVQDRVLVFGSLPPAGRDLDLLVRPAEQRGLSAGLAEHGFLRRSDCWARFADCSVEVVEMIPTVRWRLSDCELAALFEEAQPIAGSRWLVQPAPHHRLLILARRVTGGDGVLEGKLQARVDEALRQDPGAWTRAQASATQWRAVTAIDALERSYCCGTPVPLRTRVRAVFERCPKSASSLGDAPGSITSGLRWGRSVVPRPHRGFLVTLSGLDGSGKSTHAAVLADTLSRLGYDAVVQWTSLAGHPWLEPAAQLMISIATVVRRAGIHRRHGVALAPADSAPRPRRTDGDAGGGGPRRPELEAEAEVGRRLRERSRVLDLAWTLFVAFANGQWHWRAVRGRLLRGKVVICDRYVLDSKVQMRFAYGESRRYTVHMALVRALSPRPRHAYFLDASPAAVSARNDDFAPPDVERRARLYREEHRRLGVRRVNADRPLPEICAEIAADVWMGLS